MYVYMCLHAYVCGAERPEVVRLLRGNQFRFKSEREYFKRTHTFVNVGVCSVGLITAAPEVVVCSL